MKMLCLGMAMSVVVGFVVGVGVMMKRVPDPRPTHEIPIGQTGWIFSTEDVKIEAGHWMITRLTRSDWQKMVDTMRTKERVIGERASKENLRYE